jgi:hypothetical protein
MYVLIISLTILAAALLFPFLGRKARLGSPEQVVLGQESIQDEHEPEPEPEVTQDDREITKAAQAFRNGAEQRAAMYQAQKLTSRAAEEIVEKAAEAVRTSHLDIVVPYLWEEMKHWPSWSKLEPKGRWTAPVEIGDLDGDSSAKKPWIEWRTAGFLFRLEFEAARMSFDDEGQEYADIGVSVDDIEVARLRFTRNAANEFERWRFVGVDALVIGPWMAQLVEFYSTIRGVKEQQQTERTSGFYTTRAARINLGDQP